MKRSNCRCDWVALFASVSALMTVPLSAQVISIEDVNPDSSTLDATDPDGATGGRVNGIAIDPGNPLVMYAASEWGGLYKSTDGGDTWAHLTGHRPLVTWDVEVDPKDSNRIYATSLYDGRAASLSGINISTDGGATWSRPASAVPPAATCANAFDQTELSAFGISTHNPPPPAVDSVVFIGTSCGLAFSVDSGVTWSFVYHPSFSRKRVWDVVAAADGLRVDMCGDDGHLAMDSNLNWQDPSLGFPLPAGICSIAASPYPSGLFNQFNLNLYATVGTMIYETTSDDGFNWVQTRFNPNPQGRIPFVETNLRSGINTFDLWFGDISLHRVTCDRGALLAKCGSGNVPPWSGPFTRSVGGHDDMGGIVFDPTVASDACPRLMSSDGGVYRNTETTSPNCHSPIWEQPSVSPHGLWPYALSGADVPGGDEEQIYIGSQDNGVFGTINGGAADPSWANDTCCDAHDTAADSFAGGSIIYSVCCGSGGGRATTFHRKGAGFVGGSEINYPSGGLPPGFTYPDAIARWDDRKYVMITRDCTVGERGCPGADGGVFITDNVAAMPIVWTELGDATEPPSSAICGVKVARSATGVPTFYVQTGDCNSNNTTDRMYRFTGTNPTDTWVEIALPQGGFGIFAVNQNDPQLLLASGLTTSNAFMYKSIDGGANWSSPSGLDALMNGGGDFPMKNQRGSGGGGGATGVGSTHTTGYHQPSLVAMDPDDPNIQLAGGRDSGIFLSTDGGTNWTLVTDPRNSDTSGIPHIPRPWHAYFDSEPTGSKSAYVSSQGRGLWRFRLSAGVCQTNLVLANQTVTGSQAFVAANTITTGPGFGVQDSASLTLIAGNSVTMRSGTTLAGRVSVSISPSACP
ncbi:MAG: hypothetical protein GY949_20860 [Gammaproteobacteria bacterium]|nr:hypothetical protein [Gammaproteobacteria bacterium]